MYKSHQIFEEEVVQSVGLIESDIDLLKNIDLTKCYPKNFECDSVYDWFKMNEYRDHPHLNWNDYDSLRIDAFIRALLYKLSVEDQISRYGYRIIKSPFGLNHIIETNSKIVCCMNDSEIKHQFKGDYYFTYKNSIHKLDDNIYYISYREAHGDFSTADTFLVFVNTEKDLWDNIKIWDFIVKYSKKLRELEDEKNEKYLTDKNSFSKIFLPNNMLDDLKEDISSFLSSKDLYHNELGIPWKRGYMLIGPPGNGKTMLIRCICEYWGLESMDIKNCIDRNGSLKIGRITRAGVEEELFSKNKPMVYILEDIDKFTSFQSGDAPKQQDNSSITLHDLLVGLDGFNNRLTDGSLIIATTNFPDELNEAIMNRPGRFDKIYKIDKPDLNCVIKFLEYHKMKFDSNIETIAKQFDGLSMAFVEEFVKVSKMKYRRNELTIEEATQLIKKIQEHNKMFETNFKKQKKIGFA